MLKKAISILSRHLAVLKRKKGLKNHTFSIISNTCIGGVISHAVGEQFRSPTVNLVIYEYDFITFCQNLKAYSQCPLEPPVSIEEKNKFSGYQYPVGILRGNSKELPDIAVFFVHYTSFDQAKEAWHKRFARVNYDDVYLVMDCGMDASDEILDLFHQLPYKNKVFFTHKEDPIRWPQTFRFAYYTEENYVTAYMYTLVRKGLLEYRVLDEFDCVKWLNTGKIGKSIFFEK